MAGGSIKLLDVDDATFSPSLEHIIKKWSPNTVGVIVVHIGGIITPEIQDIRNWCRDHGIWLLEDCAHAHGSSIEGRFAGSFGDAGCYSFFATKVMTTGEGGMIVTDNEKIADMARLLRNHGKPEPWVSIHTHLGSNWRMNEISAIIGLSQLSHLHEYVLAREARAKIYDELLKNRLPILKPIRNQSSSGYKYIVMPSTTIDREKLKTLMKSQGVGLPGEVYSVPLHKQPVFKDHFTDENDLFPISDRICDQHFCLPIYPELTTDEIYQVVDALEKAVELSIP
jgi:dTDP-4-amino-4,6-dideoxygalactose transaminase